MFQFVFINLLLLLIYMLPPSARH